MSTPVTPDGLVSFKTLRWWGKTTFEWRFETGEHAARFAELLPNDGYEDVYVKGVKVSARRRVERGSAR